MAAPESLSLAQARRIALAAQGFADPAPAGVPTRRHLRRVLDRVGLIQMDSVNVLQRAHYLPLYSRLGPYPTDAARPGRLPPAPGAVRVLGPRGVAGPGRAARGAALADGPGARRGLGRHAADRPGAARAGRLGARRGGRPGAADRRRDRARRAPGDRQLGLELVGGQAGAGVPVLGRRGHRRRAHHLLRPPLRPARAGAAGRRAGRARRRPTPRRTARWSALAARSLGVAAEPELRDYFRLPLAGARQAIAELVEAGELLPVTVQGWRQPAWLHAEARLPRWVRGNTLVSPFDPLVWERARTERLFGFSYRIEIYVPGAAAGVRLLRAAVPAGRPVHRPGRPQGRPQGRGAAGAGGLGRARRRPGGDRGGARRRAVPARRLARPGRGGPARGRRPGRSARPPRWPASSGVP